MVLVHSRRKPVFQLHAHTRMVKWNSYLMRRNSPSIYKCRMHSSRMLMMPKDYGIQSLNFAEGANKSNSYPKIAQKQSVFIYKFLLKNVKITNKFLHLTIRCVHIVDTIQTYRLLPWRFEFQHRFTQKRCSWQCECVFPCEFAKCKSEFHKRNALNRIECDENSKYACSQKSQSMCVRVCVSIYGICICIFRGNYRQCFSHSLV